jgi:hypothetical protein
MFKLNQQYYLLVIALITLLALIQFQPKNIDGPKVKPIAAPEEGGFSHEILTEVLGKSVNDQGLVSYQSLKSSRLDEYLGLISATSPKNAPHRFQNREDQLAYYLNAYHAYLLAIIRDLCPIKSVKDVYAMNGVFWRIAVTVGKEQLNLNEIASQIQSLAQGDIRYSLLISKADRSSLPMIKKAWHREQLSQQVDAYLLRSFQYPWMEVNPSDTLVLSDLFKQYQYHFSPDPLKYFKEKSGWVDALKNVTQIKYAPLLSELNGSCE